MGQINQEVAIGLVVPNEMRAKKPPDNSHEGNLDVGGKDGLEKTLNVVTDGEVDEVIDRVRW